MMKIDILTLFPEMFSPLEHSIVGKAREKGLLASSLQVQSQFCLFYRRQAWLMTTRMIASGKTEISESKRLTI